MKITAITTIPFTLPLRRAIGFAHGSMATTEHVLVEVHTDEGLVGLDPLRTDTIRGVLDRTANNHTIKRAIDIALHDLIGQAVGQPCFAHSSHDRHRRFAINHRTRGCFGLTDQPLVRLHADQHVLQRDQLSGGKFHGLAHRQVKWIGFQLCKLHGRFLR